MKENKSKELLENTSNKEEGESEIRLKDSIEVIEELSDKEDKVEENEND